MNGYLVHRLKHLALKRGSWHGWKQWSPIFIGEGWILLTPIQNLFSKRLSTVCFPATYGQEILEAGVVFYLGGEGPKVWTQGKGPKATYRQLTCTSSMCWCSAMDMVLGWLIEAVSPSVYLSAGAHLLEKDLKVQIPLTKVMTWVPSCHLPFCRCPGKSEAQPLLWYRENTSLSGKLA